jgi:1-acyl-sn-glycerol-3-phosphate acyltransferase
MVRTQVSQTLPRRPHLCDNCGRVSDTVAREQLLTSILEFLSGENLLPVAQIRVVLERALDQAGPNALVGLKERLTFDRGWSYYPPDGLALSIHYQLADYFLESGSQVSGCEHLASVAGEPMTIVSNHLSYADANVIQVLLQRAGYAAVANRLTAVAGPKVFTNRQRRFSSLCFGTIKVPQSTEVSSEEAVLNARDVARAARHALGVAAQRLAAGDVLVLFGEGTRSRTAQMQRMLAGVARYMEATSTWVLPVGIAGTEALFPIGDVTVRPARVCLSIGTPVRADRLATVTNGNRQTMMDVVGLLISELLPQPYRGIYARPNEFAAAAQAVRLARGEATSSKGHGVEVR